MSDRQDQPSAWPDLKFWEQLEQLEGRHRCVQADHEEARRGLERLSPAEIEDLRRAWARYCEVIVDLDRACADFEALRR